MNIMETADRQKTEYVVLTLDTDKLHTIIDGQFTRHELASQFCQVFQVCLKNETKVVTCLPYPWYTKLLQLWEIAQLSLTTFTHLKKLLRLAGKGRQKCSAMIGKMGQGSEVRIMSSPNYYIYIYKNVTASLSASGP
jgi:hypothetical protein